MDLEYQLHRDHDHPPEQQVQISCLTFQYNLKIDVNLTWEMSEWSS